MKAAERLGEVPPLVSDAQPTFILKASSILLGRPNAFFFREIFPKWRNTTNENSVEQGAALTKAPFEIAEVWSRIMMRPHRGER